MGDRKGKKPQRPPHRAGAALLVVLLFTGLAVAYAYAALRTTAVQQAIIRNLSVQYRTRQAAISGIFLALKQMHHSWWEGVDTSFTAAVEDESSFTAVFRAGDPELGPSHPRWEEYPFRVTVEVRGESTDVNSAAVRARSQLRMVVRLVPRQVSSPPTGWSDVVSFTLCQWRSGTCRIQTPCRIAGPVRIRDKLDLANSIEWSSEARWDYLFGLQLLRWVGVGDFRPFNSVVYLPYGRQDSGTVSLLTIALGVMAVDSPAAAVYSWVQLPEVTSYRLYPGGKEYAQIPLHTLSLESIELRPDPLTNPLGLFLCHRDLTFRGNVQIVGHLLLRGNKSALRVVGPQNALMAPALPPYAETPEAGELRVRLPALVAEESLILTEYGELGGKGLLLIQKDLNIAKSSQEFPKMTWEGAIVATNFRIEPRTEWERSDKWWNATYSEFKSQRWWGDGIFPRWLEDTAGLQFQPKVTIVPSPDRTSYHWFPLNEPLFVPHLADSTSLEPGKAGLRWEVLALRQHEAN